MTAMTAEEKRQRYDQLIKHEQAYFALRRRLCELAELNPESTDQQILGVVGVTAPWVRRLGLLRRDLRMNQGDDIAAYCKALRGQLDRVLDTLAVSREVDVDFLDNELFMLRQLRSYLQLPQAARMRDLAKVAHMWADDRREMLSALRAVGIDGEGLTPWWIVQQLAERLQMKSAALAGEATAPIPPPLPPPDTKS